MQIDSFQLFYFNVRATLILNPDYASQADDIIAQAVQDLAAAFSFDARELGQSVAASEVIALLQRIQGVDAVELTGLYLRGNPETANDQLQALPARLEGDAILPAQLFLVNATGDNGIILTIQTMEQA
jgi:hypothetical protein